ncbi:polyphenol oxidase family protein [Patescibacteria group bacterium]|nr:polyphenol oxidase family protein [Patescibacteria group bacterium]
MIKKTKKGYYILEKFAKEKGLLHGFSSRAFGNMSFLRGEKQKVIKNRLKFSEELGFNKNSVVQMGLVHDTKIVKVDKADMGSLEKNNKIKDTDALITNKPGIFLFLLTADCMPLLLYDSKRKVIGLAHVGWRGVVGNLPNLMVEKMIKEFGSETGDILVGLGPALCDQCSLQERPLAQEDLPGWEGYLHPVGNKVRVESARFCLDQLLKLGVKKENIEASEICTKENWDKFFSHKAAQEHGTESEEGRFASVIGLF